MNDLPGAAERVIQNVRRRRRDWMMTQEELATAVTQLGLPMSRDVVANIETGRREITASELLHLAEVFHVSPCLMYAGGQAVTRAHCPTCGAKVPTVATCGVAW